MVTGPSKVYYVTVEISNIGTEPVTIKWKDQDGNSHQQISSPGSVMEISSGLVASTQPDNFQFTGVSSNGTNVVLNNVTVFEVKPTTSKEVVKIVIGKTLLANLFIA